MACNVLGCREIYLAACPVMSPSCSITHIYTHPTHLGQAPSWPCLVASRTHRVSQIGMGRCGPVQSGYDTGYMVPFFSRMIMSSTMLASFYGRFSVDYPARITGAISSPL